MSVTGLCGCGRQRDTEGGFFWRQVPEPSAGVCVWDGDAQDGGGCRLVTDLVRHGSFSCRTAAADESQVCLVAAEG